MASEAEKYAESLTRGSYRFPVQDRSFLPWHRPRKQVVRRQQLDDLLGRVTKDGSGPLRYLGLPGQDLLDIRWIADQLCERQDRDLLFLGFNSDAEDAEARFSIEEAKLKRLSRIDPRSSIVRTDFNSIAERASLGYQRALEFGPFDVINLDLCNSLAGEQPQASTPTLYNAIAQLIGVQARREWPWVLMITTRIDDQCFDADAAGRLSEIFTKNVVDCPTFEEWFRTSFDDCPADHSALLGATHHLRSQVRAVALAKWLIALGVSKRVAVSSAGCVCYSVRKTNGFPDLVSMAFVVGVAEHDAATDPHGLAQPAKIPLTFDECELAIEALISMADSTDADSALRDNEDLRSELIAETAALLGSAGHDPSAYMLWANQGETA